MQAFAEIDKKEEAQTIWLAARDAAVAQAEALLDLGLHKQVPNRLLEPFTWITEVISATTWTNFFALRCHEMAEPHIQKIAYMMRDALAAAEPIQIQCGDWHTPFVDSDEIPDIEVRKQVSVVRCARTSYNRHLEKRPIEEDLTRFNDLSTQGHWSPFEHVAQATHWAKKPSNFSDTWEQLRKTFANECQ
jgi:thymidylate synthase ThyX